MKLLCGLFDLARMFWWLGHDAAQDRLEKYRRWMEEWNSLAGR